MPNSSEPSPLSALAPVATGERIQALDVVRGFALLGIFLMNVEFFNRPLSELDMGLPDTLTGIDWWAGWLVYDFVQGKFWTMFSLLFGMGFAVMLTRAERAGRSFLRPYLRRIAVLGVLGAAHHIFIWAGDILFSYAVGALALLLLLYGNARALAAAFVALVACGFIPGFDGLWDAAGGLACIGVAGWFLRSEQTARIGDWDVPEFSLAPLAIGTVLAAVALGFWLVPGAPSSPRLPLSILAGAFLAIGVFSARFHQPPEARMRRLGIGMYVLPFLLMAAFGLSDYAASQAPTTAPNAGQVASDAPAGHARADKPERRSDPEAEARAEQQAERIEREFERARQAREEIQTLTQGSYAEAVRLRAGHFVEDAPGQSEFAVVIVGVFLLGAWFVRSGVMEDTAAHLPLFRKLALYGIPFGCGLGLAASAISTGQQHGQSPELYQFASALHLLGNLPACLGYVGLLVLMLHSKTVLAKISVVAPAGRMALSNYLAQSVIGTLVFYGYGLGYWGLGRAWQVLFAVVVFALQVVFSHWWLSKFRYGPLEWLWRAATYWQVPAMRREPPMA